MKVKVNIRPHLSVTLSLCVPQMHAKREESYIQLQSHRHKMKEDKYLLQEHEREHSRLLKIGARSETLGEGLY